MSDEKNSAYNQTIKLPSKGLLYDVESPLYQKTELEISPMTTADEDILTSRNLIKRGTALETMLKNCLVDKSIDPAEMYSFDRNILAVSVRALSYGADYDAKIQCPNCDHKFTHTFDLSKIEVNYFDENIKHNSGIFDFILPMSKDKIKFKFLTGKEEQKILDVIKISNKKESIVGDITHLVSTKWIEQIVEFNGEKEKTKFAPLIRKMFAKDSNALKNYIDNITPGLVLDFDIVCTSCDEEFTQTLPIDVNFFWPSSK